MKHLAVLAAGLVLAACAPSRNEGGSESSAAASTAADDGLAARTGRTLADLAAFGDKRAGTPAATRAATYLAGRFRRAGLDEVHFEEFSFPKFEAGSSSLAVTLDGASSAPKHEVLAYSGSGHVAADVVYVHTGHPADYTGLDVHGKIVLVDRDARFHRATQLALVAQNGGLAMLWASTAPNDLLQVGTVSLSGGSLGPAPAVSISASDAQKIRDALAAGRPAQATVDVSAEIREGTGRNVVGTLRGSDDAGAYFVVGAHYDTWFTGSYDNGAGVAAMLAIAEDFAQAGGRKQGVRFVAYDAEEPGLFGGYDYLRKHIVEGCDPVLGFVNFETPANDNDGTKALAHTNGSPFNTALTAEGLQSVYPAYIGMEVLQPLFGGVIPTDIQGMYRYGVQGTTTLADSPYYHTVADTPDKVDLTLLSSSVSHFEAALGRLDGAVPASFEVHDPALWRPDVTTSLSADDTLTIAVVAKDASGAPQAGAAVEAWVDVNDFTPVARQTATTDSAGAAWLVFPLDPSVVDCDSSWVHVTTGKTFPLSENIARLPPRH